jgi:hypothetical protein
MGVTPSGGISEEWFNKWVGYVIDAMSCYNKDGGYWVHLPSSGGYYDQDEYTMGLWENIKYMYIKAMRDPEVISYLQSEGERREKDAAAKINKLRRK